MPEALGYWGYGGLLDFSGKINKPQALKGRKNSQNVTFVTGIPIVPRLNCAYYGHPNH